MAWGRVRLLFTNRINDSPNSYDGSQCNYQKWLAFNELKKKKKKYRTAHKEDKQVRGKKSVSEREFSRPDMSALPPTFEPLTSSLQWELVKLSKTKQTGKQERGQETRAVLHLRFPETNRIYAFQTGWNVKALRNHIWWQMTALYFSATFL